MILVQRGNLLPTVAVVQRLLKTFLGTPLHIDGNFGSATQQAARDFQGKKGLNPDGIVGPDSWRKLSAGRELQVLDHVDAADDYHDSPRQLGYEYDLLRVGGSPTVSYHQSAGIERAARQIQAAGHAGRVILLRFHGHGRAGVMTISRGQRSPLNRHAGSISLYDLDWQQIQQYFGPLHSIFHPLGSVELHGCNVAGQVYDHGYRVNIDGYGVGPYFLRRLSTLWGVPITASPNSQYSHGSAILPFEGRTITVCPDGYADIESWAQNRDL